MIYLIRFLLCIIFLFCFSACSEEQGVAEVKQVSTKLKKEKRWKKKVKLSIGHEVDVLHGVSVYYNGAVRNTSGRNYSKDGYSYGLKWQCVEFVKRYYHQSLKHKMPNPWGHAKDFFNPQLKDGAFNTERGLYQFKNGSFNRIQVDDIIVFSGTDFNQFGHIAIVSKVEDYLIEIVQQNVGIETRMSFAINPRKGYCFVKNPRVLGWLGKR